MKKIILILVFLPTILFSQNRNENVMKLNKIMWLMDISHRLDTEYFDRASEFCANVCGKSSPKNWVYLVSNKVSLFSSVGREDSVAISLLKSGKFKELKPDKENMIFSYEDEVVWYFLTKEYNQKIIQNKDNFLDISTKNALDIFISTTDELVKNYLEMMDYTKNEQQLTDKNYKTAKKIASKFEYMLKKFRIHQNNLYNEVRREYKEKYPQLPKNQQKIINATAEMDSAFGFLEESLADLFENKPKEREFYIAKAEKIQKEALEKMDSYFTGYYGYKDPNFKGYMESCIKQYENFFYCVVQTSKVYISASNITFGEFDDRKGYNQRLRLYNHTVKAYNDFVDWADGQKKLKWLKGRQRERFYNHNLDSTQNILLQRPFYVNQFKCACADDMPYNEEVIVKKTEEKIIEKPKEVVKEIVKEIPKENLNKTPENQPPTNFKEIEIGKAVALKNVLFKISTAELLPESKSELDNLAKFMQGNENAEIQLEGHTDIEGNAEGNMNLSKSRVEVIKSYLIKNKINKKRIKIKWFGASKPIRTDGTYEDRKINRRVECILLKK